MSESRKPISEKDRLAGDGACHSSPINPFEKGVELDFAQGDRPVLRFRPGETLVVQSFHDQDETGAIPDQKLEPVGAAGPEHVDRPRIGIEVEIVGDTGGEPIHPLAEVDRLGGEKNAGRERGFPVGCVRRRRNSG